MNCSLVGSASLFKDRDGLPKFSVSFEITEQENRVGKIADIDRRVHAVAYETVLREGKDGRDPLLVQVGNQFMKLQDQKLFPRHRM